MKRFFKGRHVVRGALRTVLLCAATVVSVGLLTVGQGAAVAEASPVPNSRLMSCNAPSARCGQTVTWTVRLTAGGRPVANCPLAVTWRSDARGASMLSPVMTDSNGYARISFSHPTNVRDDNVILTAISAGGRYTAVVSQRVGITR